MFNKNHVGRVVSDPQFGNGIIKSFNIQELYSVTVQFNDCVESYTADGRWNKRRLPTLQFGLLDNWTRRMYERVIWLDDVRDPKDHNVDAEWVKTFEEFQQAVIKEFPDMVHFDNDLGRE